MKDGRDVVNSSQILEVQNKRSKERMLVQSIEYY